MKDADTKEKRRILKNIAELKVKIFDGRVGMDPADDSKADREEDVERNTEEEK